MAKKYTVKATDNLLTLSQKFGTSPNKILSTNGLQTLTPGQTINIPNVDGVLGDLLSIFKPSNFVPIQFDNQVVTPVSQQIINNPKYSPSSSFPVLSPALSPVSTLRPVQTGGNLSPDARGGNVLPAYTGFQTPTTNGFMTTSSQPINNGFIGDQMGGQVPNTVAAPASASATIPVVSRAEAKAQFLSGNGLNPNSNYIPTRSDVWNMKANARRKAGRKNGGDDQTDGSGYIAPSAPPVVPPPTLQNQGNFVNTAVSWRL